MLSSNRILLEKVYFFKKYTAGGIMKYQSPSKLIFVFMSYGSILYRMYFQCNWNNLLSGVDQVDLVLFIELLFQLVIQTQIYLRMARN